MATIAENAIDLRGCPAIARFTVPSANTWVALLIDGSLEAGATRVAITVTGGGKLSTTGRPGAAVGASEDYQLLPDGLAYYFDLDPNGGTPHIRVAVDTDASDIHVHLTSSPLRCGCRR